MSGPYTPTPETSRIRYLWPGQHDREQMRRLAQTTAVGDLAGRHSTLRRISSLFFGLWDKMRDRANP